jgi:hypothetical protein
MACTMVVVVPMWQARWLPIQDLPQHLATIRILHEVHRGGPAGALYDVDLGRTQYVLFYILGDALAYVFSFRTAGLLLLSTYMLGTVAAMHALLRSLDRDTRLALLTVPLLTNAPFLLGLVQFLLAVPLMLWGFSLAVDYARAWRRRDGVLLALVSAATFYSHIVPFGVMLAGLAILAPWRSPRRLTRYGLPLVPVALCLVRWVFFTRSGDFVRNAITGDVENKDTWPIDRSFHAMYDLAFDTYRDSADEKLFVIAVVVAVAMTVLARSRQTSAPGPSTARWLLIPFACSLLYFHAEGSNGFLGHIRDRFALLAVFLLVPALRMPRAVAGALGTCAMVMVSLMTAETWRWHLARFDVECGDFDGALAHIPPNERVAGLIYSTDSKLFEQDPYLHYASYYLVDRGGSVGFSFAGYPHWVYSYKPHEDPLGASPSVFLWEWEPQRRELREEIAASYDYVLTRGSGFEPLPDWFTRVWEGDRWSVWARRKP